MIIDSKVYDVTKFLDDHPGGAKAIAIYAGKDATEQFDMLHERNVIDKYAPDTYIGDLVAQKAAVPYVQNTESVERKTVNQLTPSEQEG